MLYYKYRPLIWYVKLLFLPILLTVPLTSLGKTEPGEHLPLKIVADVPIPGNPVRWDYQSLDVHSHLLFLSHLGDSSVVVFDTKNNKIIATIPGISHVHGVLVVPNLHRVYAAATGTNQIVVINENTLQIVTRIPGGRHPDGIAYAPNVNRLFVSDELGGTDTVIDPATNQRIDTIDFGGQVGNTQYDPVSGLIYANDQTDNQLVEINPVSDRVVARYPLPGARGNHGLLIAPNGQFAFIACAGNDKMLVVDMRTKHIVKSFNVGIQPDVLAFDDRLGLLYLGSESGVVTMFNVGDHSIKKVGERWLGPDAHSVSVDPSTHLVYFPLIDVNGRSVLRIMRPMLNGLRNRPRIVSSGAVALEASVIAHDYRQLVSEADGAQEAVMAGTKAGPMTRIVPPTNLPGHYTLTVNGRSAGLTDGVHTGTVRIALIPGVKSSRRLKNEVAAALVKMNLQGYGNTSTKTNCTDGDCFATINHLCGIYFS